MKNRFHFYINKEIHDITIDEGFDYFFFTPSLFNRKLHKGLYKQSNLLYLFWFIFTLGQYKIFYIKDRETNEIAHFSNILTSFFKFNFMKKGDIQISHCWTYDVYRGKKLYPFALLQIMKKYHAVNIWIGSRSSNTSSINAIEKSGFKRVFDVEKRTILGIYYKINE